MKNLIKCLLILITIGTVNLHFAYSQNNFQGIYIAGGGNHTVALKCDGTVWCWGDNSSGQIGDNTIIDKNTPEQVLGAGGVGFLEDVIAVAAGGTHSLALISDGTVWTWGDNDEAQLGDSSVTDRHTPVQVVGPGGTGFLTNIIAIEAGTFHSIALRSDGTVWCWGDDSQGQCGDGPSNAGLNYPIQVEEQGTGFISNVTAISAGYQHNVVLKNDGTAWTWGLNDNGQLAIGGWTQEFSALQVVGVGGVGYLSNITAISTGYNHTLFLRDDGQVIACGKNNLGQLGNGTNSPTNNEDPLLSNTTNAISIVGGENHSIVQLNDGSVVTWGYDFYYQLGDDAPNNGAYSTTPVSVVGIDDDVVAVALGANHSLALLENGYLQSWGLNTDGQLGNGNNTDQDTAVDVLNYQGFFVANAGADQSYCNGDSVQIGEASTPGITYSWSPTFGLSDPNISNPYVNATAAATITINYILTTSISGTCVSQDVVSVTVRAGAIAEFTSDAPACMGQSVNFLNTGASGTGILFVWNFGSGATPATSTDENPAGIVYNSTGLKLVTLTVSDSLCGGYGSESNGILIYEQPVASFTSADSVCIGSTVNFSNTGTSGQNWSYFWDFGEGAYPATSGSENPSGVTYSSSGTKTVTFSITNGYCTHTNTSTVTIFSTPIASFVTSSNKCTGETVDFTNTGTTTGVTYSWNFGSGATPATSTAQDPAGIVYSTSGIKIITLTTTNTTTICTSTSTQTINISLTPTASFTSTAPVCVGSVVNFTNTGSTGIGITYNWDLGSGATPATSTAQNPAGITYATSGIKTVTLNVVNEFGCSALTTQNITISATPTANFTSTAPKCTGETVDFTNTGTTTGVTYSWNFGIGATPATSTAQDPAGIVYSTSGIKIITLTTTNTTTICTSTSTQTINISLTPTASFTSTAPVCVGSVVNFTNTGSTGIGITYNWDLGSGATPATSTAQNPSGVTYTTAGTKTVTLNVVNEFGCSALTTQNITISTTPTAGFTSTAPKCTGETVDFTNTGTTAGVTFLWNFGSGATPATSTAQDPAGIVYSTSGIKIITLTTTNTTTNCTSTSTQTINISLTPTASFTSTAPVCVGSVVNFTNTGSTGIGITYNWDLGSGATPATSTAQNPSGVTYTTAGTKTVTLNVVNEFGCSALTTQNITINATPTANFTSTAPKCTGETVDFTNTGTTAGVTFLWNFGSGATPATSTAQNPAGIIYSTSGIKIITLTTTNTTTNCTSTSTQTINISLTPTASFTSTAPVCIGSIVNFTNTGSTGIGITYNWDFGSGATPATSTSQNPSGIVYSTSGTKTVTLNVVNEFGCSALTTQNITISATPTANFTFISPNSSNCTGDSVNFLNTGTTGAVYAWNFGSGATPGTSTAESPQNIVYSIPGIKTVTLISTLGTCTDTSTQTINIIQTPAPSFTHNAPQCEGLPVNFTYTGTVDTNFVYLWDFGAGSTPSTSSQMNPQNVNYTGGGTKLVLLTVSNGLCSEKATASFIIDALPVADAGKDTTICADRSVQIGSTSVSNTTYSWFPESTLDNPDIANPVASPIAPVTVYIVTVTNTITGCQATDSVIVTMLASLAANAGIDVEICRHDSIQIGAALIEGQTYVWSPSTGISNINTPNPMASPDSTTTYTLSVTGSGCEEVSDDVTVIVHPLPEVSAGEDDTITLGSGIQLVATGGVQYEWTPDTWLSNSGIFNPVANPEINILYSVMVTDIYGCYNSDSIYITVIKPSFWLPNAFTPDGNGFNDLLYVRGEGINNFDFSIFNSWGEKIFYTTDIKYGWDGRKQVTGEEMPEGAYVYYIKGTMTNGEPVNFKGMVNLIR